MGFDSVLGGVVLGVMIAIIAVMGMTGTKWETTTVLVVIIGILLGVFLIAWDMRKKPQGKL